jgi:hypothetical protein
MPKFSIFSVVLLGSLLVTPFVTANNFSSLNKSVKAQNLHLSISSLSSINSSLLNQSSSLNISDSASSLIFNSNSSLQNIKQSESSSSAFKKVKVITDVKPVRLNVQAANWWTDTDILTGGNSDTSGIDAINSQIQSKLQTQCPNIYDINTKVINETNLSNCAPINNLPIQKIAIIDSGVTPSSEMLPYIDQANSWNFFTSNNYPAICTVNSILRFYTLVQGDTSTYYCKEKGTQSDTDYHGTVVAYTAIQTFKNSLLKNRIKIVPFSLRTLDTINISEAIDEVARANDIKTVNMSVGTPYNVQYVKDSVDSATAASIDIYASSGNCAVYTSSNCDYNGNTVQDLPEEANNAPDYPASYQNTVMVGSNNYSENNIPGIIRATYSNFATALRSNFVTAPVGNSGIILPCFVNCNGTTNYSYLGTSFASPQAAGLDVLISKYSALMKQNLGQQNEKVLVASDTPKQYVTDNTTDILDSGNDLQTGNGLINLKKISDKIVSQLQTFNVPTSSSSLLASSSTISNISSNSVTSSSVVKDTMINSITLNFDNSAYIVTSTSNFTPAFGSDHIHFYYNTEANTVMNKMFSNAGPYSILTSTKPTNATQLCTIVGTASHGIYPGTGNCFNLPIISSGSSISSSVLSSSSNVLSSSSIQSVLSSAQAAPAISSQVLSSSQINSSSAIQNSSSVNSASSQSIISSSSSQSSLSQGSTTTNSGGGVISLVTGIISNVINSLTGANANTNGNKSAISSISLTSTSQNSKTFEVVVKEQIVKQSEDATFAGLINNPNGSTNPSLNAIKEQGVKVIENQSSIEPDNQNPQSSVTYTQGRKNEIDSESNSLVATDKSLISSQDSCQKSLDDSNKGGKLAEDCKSPIGVNPQSDISPSNDISKYIPVVILSIVGVGGAATISSFVLKQKAWLTGK